MSAFQQMQHLASKLKRSLFTIESCCCMSFCLALVFLYHTAERRYKIVRYFNKYPGYKKVIRVIEFLLAAYNSTKLKSMFNNYSETTDEDLKNVLLFVACITLGVTVEYTLFRRPITDVDITFTLIPTQGITVPANNMGARKPSNEEKSSDHSISTHIVKNPFVILIGVAVYDDKKVLSFSHTQLNGTKINLSMLYNLFKN